MRAWWPELMRVADGLRANGHTAAAQALAEAPLGCATGSEVLGNVGLVLREHHAKRSALDADARQAWDRVMHDVNGHNTPQDLWYRFLRSLGL